MSVVETNTAAKREGEDEIEASRAPLIDHLIELRSRLIKSLIAFLIMFFICFGFSTQIYNILVKPYVWAAGSAANRINVVCICAGVPSNSRPQPRLNKVSPQNSRPSPTYATWLRVCPGTAMTANRQEPMASVSPSSTR